MAYLAEKENVGKMAIFEKKPWVNSFGYISIFRLFEHVVFIAQKDRFTFQNNIKHILMAYMAEKENVGKMGIFEKKMG